MAGRLECGQQVDVCYQPEIDDYNGPDSVRLRLCDMAADRPLTRPSAAHVESTEVVGGEQPGQ